MRSYGHVSVLAADVNKLLISLGLRNLGMALRNIFANVVAKHFRLSIVLRRTPVLKSISYRMASTVKCTGRELRIPTPIGDIAALEWGPPNGIPVLALHGWQDNSMSFQPLIPYLPPNFHVVAIDFPGHGLSPHLGLGAHYTHFGLFNNTFQVAKSLKWDKFNIIAHSLGAMIGIQFAAFYPQRVERLVTLDIMYPQVEKTLSLGPSALPGIMKHHTLMEIRESSPPVTSTWDEALKAFSKDRKTSSENITMILSRAVKPSNNGNGWVMTRDHRIRHLNVPKMEFTEPEAVMKMLENYEGSWLAIMSRDDEVSPKKLEREKQMRERYGKSMKLFHVERIKSGHFVHMDHPETVGKYISSIFEEIHSKL